MSNRTIRNLAIVLFALIAILIGLEFSNSGSSPTTSGDQLFGELREQLNELDRLVIEQPGAEGDVEQTVITRSDDGWAVATRGDYPADVGKVRDVLLALAEAQVLEEKTSNPERYEAIGVRDPETEGSRGVRLTGSGDGAEFAVILGDVNQGSNRYARVAGQATSVLIDSNPSVPEVPGAWLASELVDIDAGEVGEVVIEHADGETLRVAKASVDEVDFTVADVPEGRELSYPSVANTIADALDDLTLTDVRAGDAVADGESTTESRLTTFDGLQVDVSVFDEDGSDARWVTIAAQVAEPLGDAEEGASEDDVADEADSNDSDSDAADEGEAAPAEPSVEDRVAAINERTAGRQFRIDDYKLDQLTRRWDDILMAEADEAEEDAE